MAAARHAPTIEGGLNMFKRIPNTVIGGFSDAVVVETGDYSTVYISGHVGNDASGKVSAKTFAEEVDVCFANIARALERSGAGMKDVVRITCYLTDLAEYSIYSKKRAATFQGNPPASATVQVAGLLMNAKIEIDAIAVIKTKR
jgi:2-iminobutanoate/2-iminopropanoate deaminase